MEPFKRLDPTVAEPTAYDCVGSLVLYKTLPKTVRGVLESFFSTRLKVKLYVLDNSPTSEARSWMDPYPVVYIHTGRNLGFGSAHNIALRSEDSTPYRLVLNPDVTFGPETLEKLKNFMDENADIGLLMPRVLNPDGSLQYLCRELPTVPTLIARRFLPHFIKKRFQKHLDRAEFRNRDYGNVLDVPCLSGCFMFFRSSTLKEVGVFDERFFMYFEDVDLCRRIGQKRRLVYYPEASIYHQWGRGSYRNLRLLMIHIFSALKYFNKWGFT